jgi:ribosomal protein S18 acetylase RimI-like enzyme
VHASFNGEVVGYGRLVGDGGLYIYIQDLIVHPKHQGQGIGNSLLEELHNIVREMKSSRRRVVLVADSGVQGFYEKAGYLESIPVSKILKKAI